VAAVALGEVVFPEEALEEEAAEAGNSKKLNIHKAWKKRVTSKINCPEASLII
jgi:hypothetical protein